MSLPGRFMLAVAGTAVLCLMAVLMVRTIETYGDKTLAGAGPDQVTQGQTTEDQVTEVRKPLPAGPRRFQ